MAALIRKNLRLWGYGKAVALFAGCLLFSISGRLHDGIYFEQHLLTAVSDHYYLTYFMLPIVLLSCFSFLDDDKEPVILRFESYHAYFLRKWLGVGMIALLLVVVQTGAILLSGAGLTRGDGWELAAGATETELFSTLRQHFSTPLQAFIGFTLYQLAGSWFIFGICMWISHFAGRTWSVRIVAALYIISAVWLKLPAVQNLPLTGLNHLLILHHNLGSHSRLAMTGMTLLLLALMVSLTVRFAWRGRLPRFQPHGRGIAAYYLRELTTGRNILILCGVVLGIVFYKGVGHGYGESGAEWIYTLFAGHGTGYFQVLPFLELLITGGAPLFLLAVFTERTVNGQSIFISVRTSSRKNIMLGIVGASAQFLAAYSLLWLAGGLLGAILFGFGLETPAYQMLIYAVVLKYLDILLQYLVMLSFYIFTKQITTGFLVLLAGNLLCMLPGQTASYFPFGFSSLTRISLTGAGVGLSAPMAFGAAASLSALMIAGLAAFGYKKILN